MGPSLVLSSPHSSSSFASSSSLDSIMAFYLVLGILFVVLIMAALFMWWGHSFRKECLQMVNERIDCMWQKMEEMERHHSRYEFGCQGPAGKDGSHGFHGQCGFQGSRGFQGVQGKAGPQGVRGLQGNVGSRGFIGYTGSQGPQGYVGLSGDAGSQGAQGSTGATGATGSSSVLTFVGKGALVLDPTGDGDAITLGADTVLNSSIIVFTLSDTFQAQAGMAYVRMPRSGILSTLYFSIQLISPLVSVVATDFTITVYVASTEDDPFTTAPTFSVTGLAATASVPVAGTFATAKSIVNSVSVSAGDFLCLTLSTPLSVAIAVSTIECGIQFL